MPAGKGIEAENRKRLDSLHRQFSDPFSVSQAATSFNLSIPETRRRLAYFASRGWLSRIVPGIYATIPLGADLSSGWREDPWLVAARVFQPCYLGGWTACEHWGLTEQIFHKLVVITGRKLPHRETTIQGTSFLLKTLPVRQHFGTQPVWKGQTRVNVSDPARTLIDILNEPRLGGGIRHVAEILSTCFAQKRVSVATLLDYALRMNNRTIFKRLGYLLEALEIPAPELIASCQAHKSTGLTKLDPEVDHPGRISKRWNLRINVEINPYPPS